MKTGNGLLVLRYFNKAVVVSYCGESGETYDGSHVGDVQLKINVTKTTGTKGGTLLKI